MNIEHAEARVSTARVSLVVALAWAGTTFATSNEAGDHWFQGGRLTPQAVRVMDVLRNADAYGLRPADYPLPGTGATDLSARRQFDRALSRTVSRFVSDLHYGRIDPRSAGFHLPAARQDLNLATALHTVATSTDVESTLATFEPEPAPYARLKPALTRYRALAQQPSLTRLPPLPRRSLQQGDEYSGAQALRRLLVAVGDLQPADVDSGTRRPTIDAALGAAIRKFQERHGLDRDGAIGPATYAALTTPLEVRAQQIALSMERWRWLATLDRPNIAVNIPQSMLLVLPETADQRAPPLEMRVIVGQNYPQTRTPIFASSITQVVFQPYWDVPAGILQRELLSPIRRNPAYLAGHDLEIVDGQGDDAQVVVPTAAAIDALAAGALRLRQRPGATNALGPIKFVMRNPFNVYLHATPERELFERSRRTFSHGCIRVSEPAALAAHVLRHASGDWTAAAIASALQGNETLRVTLTQPVNVVVFYSTAVVTASGTVMFFEDVYGRDRDLQRMLDTAVTPVRERSIPAA
jgi:murein L,D-transpeptidase YcbB/YkuD